MRFAFLISFIIYRHSLKHMLLNILWYNKSIWLNYLLNSKTKLWWAVGFSYSWGISENSKIYPIVT